MMDFKEISDEDQDWLDRTAQEAFDSNMGMEKFHELVVNHLKIEDGELVNFETRDGDVFLISKKRIESMGFSGDGIIYKQKEPKAPKMPRQNNGVIFAASILGAAIVIAALIVVWGN